MNGCHLIRTSLILGMVGTSLAQDTRLRIEFPGFFSGRPDPLVAVGDSARAQAILDSLAVRLERDGSACVLPELEALTYNGVRLRIDEAAMGKRSYDLRGGCLTGGRVDAARNLEKMAVAAAFFEDDRVALGGPKPFTYLACGFPDSLRPASVPCATTRARSRAPIQAIARPSMGRTNGACVRADGETVESKRGRWLVVFPGTESRAR